MNKMCIEQWKTKTCELFESESIQKFDNTKMDPSVFINMYEGL